MEPEVPVDCVDSKSRKSYEKVGRIYNAVTQYFDKIFVEALLRTEGDINHGISNGRHVVPNILFFANRMEIDVLVLLLDHGADFTSKNDEGRTIVHELIRAEKDDLLRFKGAVKNQFVDAILSAHVKFKNTSNPCDETGMSHFHAACVTNHESAVEFFLKTGIDVNQALNANSSSFPLDTPLHLAAIFGCVESLEILLHYGANTLLKNADGMTALHLLVEIYTKKLTSKESTQYEKTLNIFLKHIMNDLSNVNTPDDFGFCKFHVVCLLEDQFTVENVLEQVANIDQPVNFDSPVCPGFTALHFAAFANVQIFHSLLENGANIAAKNARGSTPFDLCLRNYTIKDIHSILTWKKEWRSIALSDNETKLIDVVSATENAREFVSLLNRTRSTSTIFVPFDSPLWPGYTLLHLAVVFSREASVAATYRRQTHVMPGQIAECLKRGADVTLADSKGSTALHLAFYMQKRHVVEYLLGHHDKFRNPTDRHSLSHFHIACAAGHREAVEHFLSFVANVDSPVLSSFEWSVEHERSGGDECSRRFFVCPGSTALHINVASGNLDITRQLLKRGADVQAEDANGFTPVHRLLGSTAVRFHEGIADLLLSARNLGDRVSSGGLGHLHVACYFGHTKAIRKLMKSAADVNALVTRERKGKSQPYDQDFDRYGDPDGPLMCLSNYADYAPIHFSCLNGHDQANLLLIEGGADVLLKTKKGNSFLAYLSNHLRRHYNATCMLNSSKALRIHFEREYGLTKLHIACCTANLRRVEKLMRRGAIVNAKVRSHSPIWQGYTPLHVAAKTAFAKLDEKLVIFKLKKIIRLLIKHGADLNSTDDNRDTPLHLYLTHRQFLSDHPFSRVLSFFSFLFDHVRRFDVNPTNFQGLSLFHIACIRQNAVIVEAFLKDGVDVNQSISCFSDFCPGSTPLHLVVEYYQLLIDSSSRCGSSDDNFLRIVDMLLEKGADVNATDAFGNTPLIKGVSLTRLLRRLIPKLMRYGADVHATNVRGNTAFELLLRQEDSSWEEIELFLKIGCQLDSYNPISCEGYMAEIFRSHWTGKNKISQNQLLLKILDNPRISENNRSGRTVIHNVISIRDSIRGTSMTYYAELIQQLMIRGCSINHQDNEGKTALHLAESFVNKAGIIGLLKNGANVNLIDKSGKMFFAHVCGSPGLRNEFWTDPRDVMVAFAIHVHKLEFSGLRVNELNKQQILEKLERCYILGDKAIDCFRDEIEQMKDMKIGTTLLLLYEYLMSKDTDMYMTNEESWELDQFFEDIAKYNFLET